LLVMHQDIEASAVTGANLAQPLAIVMLSQEAVQRIQDPAAKAALTRSLEAHLQAINQQRDHHERMDYLAVVSTPWTPENGFVTPTFKVKRNRIDEEYAPHFAEWAQSGKPVVWVS